ncbi:hypothetical protein HPB49_025988 [Dermacentor silvarum]|nr:hypothetical protein HPB49_025988 [Dermacentor silvarum]
MDHTRDATKLLVDYMTREGFAFAIVSDPYTRDDSIPHVPHSLTTFHAPVAPRVVLLARAPGFDLFPLYVSQHVVAVGCESAGQAFIVIATYAPPHRPIDPILDELNQCFSRYSSSNVILAGDFNAKHALWGPPPGDPRGVQLVQFACANDLCILNSPDSPPTFETPYAHSWIDVTLASVPLTRNGYMWSVSDADTLSDHRYLVFSFSGTTCAPTKRLTNFARCQILESLRRSVWFAHIAHCEFSSGLVLDMIVNKFYNLYDALHRANLRTVKARGPRANAWWTPELAVERSRVRALRRRMQGTRDPDLRGVFRQQYARASAIYKRNIRSAKASFDKTLCDELTRKHLFGQPFKLAFDKLRPATHLPPLEGVDGTATSSVLGSAALLLRTHVATDNPAGDSDLHRCIRRVVGAAYPRAPDDLPFTPTEIEHAVFLGNPRAAPGLDGLTAIAPLALYALRQRLFALKGNRTPAVLISLDFTGAFDSCCFSLLCGGGVGSTHNRQPSGLAY